MDFSKATIGVNSATVGEYLNKIKQNVIEEAKNTLANEQEALFEVFRANWNGVSEANFESLMAGATEKVKESLEAHYTALSSKVNAINNAWVEQDAGMISKGGN